MNTLTKVVLGLGIVAVVVVGVWIFYIISNFGDYTFEIEGSENVFGANAGSAPVDYRKGLWNQTHTDAGDNYTLPNITIQRPVVWLSSPVYGNIDGYENPSYGMKTGTSIFYAYKIFYTYLSTKGFDNNLSLKHTI